MTTRNLAFQDPGALEGFAAKCASVLLASTPMEIVQFPPDTSASHWCQTSITTLNRELLGRLRNNGNVYALFLRSADSPGWIPKYVGKSSRSLLRSRIVNHLAGKHALTGSKLDEVRRAVLSGGTIGISYILVEPEELRGYIEEKLIQHVDGWNQHAAARR